MRLLAAALLLALASCAAPQPIVVACPEVHHWTAGEQKEMLAAYVRLPAGSILRPVIQEWIGLHKQAEACN